MGKTHEINEFLEDLIVNLDSTAYDSIKPEFSKKIANIVNSLRRCQKEFNSNLFLILAFGPVKSGKSTLINLLAREEEVSPTKFGVECTLRPSIILKAKNQPCIKRYISKTSQFNVDTEKENFNLVLDYIRGIATLDELENSITIEEYDFSVEKIQKYVAGDSKDYSDIGREPLITVIEVEAKNTKIIDDNTAIVDVPGLDGIQSNWRKSAVHDWILTRSDFLLFVQSSMAALNVETINFLKEVYINSKEPPMQLVQNIIEAKHWRGKKYLMEEASEQRQKGVEQILDIIPYYRNSEFDSTEVNLGIAHDIMFFKSVFEDNHTLKSSGYNALEDKLINLLNLRREKIQLDNSLKSLKNVLSDSLQAFGSFESEIIKILREIDFDKKNFNKISKDLNNVIINSNTKLIFNNIFEEDMRFFLDGVLSKYKLKFKLIANDNFDKISITAGNWKELKNDIESKIQSCMYIFKDSDYNYDSELANEILIKLNTLIHKNIEKSLFDEEVNLSTLLKKVKSEVLINADDYSHFIARNDLGNIFKDPKINEQKIFKIKEPGHRFNPLREVDFKKSIEENKKILINNMNSFIDVEFKENIEYYIEKSLNQSINKLIKDVQDIRIPFEARLKKSREECLIMRKIIQHYTPLIEGKISEINQML